MTDKKDDDDDKEWKSSHDRFVETLERFMTKAATDQAKQERVANGFYLEISRKELLSHLQARALFYTDEAFRLTEQGVEIPDLLKSPNGDPMVDKNTMLQLEEIHKTKIHRMNARAKAFEFASKHLPEGKEVFLMVMEGLPGLDFVPQEFSSP